MGLCLKNLKHIQRKGIAHCHLITVHLTSIYQELFTLMRDGEDMKMDGTLYLITAGCWGVQGPEEASSELCESSGGGQGSALEA